MSYPVPTEVVEGLKALDRWTLVSHHSPDGDTLGCAAALVALGRQLGKKVGWVGKDELPARYTWLPNAELYRAVGDTIQPSEPTIWVDISTVERGIVSLSKEVKVNIDHHPTNELFGTVNWVVPEASATGELVWAVAKAMVDEPCAEIATCLYVALVTDNGNFTFPSVTAHSFDVAADLLRYGADPAKIDLALNHQDRPNKLKLWGRCLARLETVGEHGVMSWITEDDFETTEAFMDETEELVNQLTKIDRADIVALVIEAGDRLRCSFRSRAPYSARSVAESFGGGGHELAAGARLRSPLEAGLRRVAEALLHAQRIPDS